MHYTQTLHKVCSQGRHFVFRFFRIATASPATSPSSSSRTPTAIPHGGMFELHQILEDWITEHTASVLGLPGRKWRASLVEVDCDQRGVAGLAALLSNLWGERTRGRDEETLFMRLNDKSVRTNVSGSTA